MAASATAICCSQSGQFRLRSSRTMIDKCKSWTRTLQGGNMPISLKTQVDRTAKTPIPARRARVGGLCRFRNLAERVPAGSPKTGRCAAVRARCGNAKSRKGMPAGGFRQREKPQAAKQEQKRDACVNRTIFLQGKTEHTYMDCFGADCYQPDSHKLAPEKRCPNSAKAAPQESKMKSICQMKLNPLSWRYKAT